MKKFMEFEDSKGLRGLLPLDKIESILEVEDDGVHKIILDTEDGRIRLVYNNERIRDKTYNQIKEFLGNDAILIVLEGVRC